MDSAQLKAEWAKTVGDDADFASLSLTNSYRPRNVIQDIQPDTPPKQAFLAGELIGKGGMGEVFRAQQCTLEREVALKKLRGSKAGNDKARSRFLAEGVVTGRLQHPNIVPVHSLDTDADGQLFMAMKLIEGRSWKEILRGPGDAGLDAHLDILLQVCNAVAFAHSKDIVHNDLKPANVMVGNFGEVLVVDWGLAVSIAEHESDTRVRHKSTVNTPCGTPLYIAPELARGQGDQIGPRTDVYLLGGMLCEVLLGRPPHTGKDLMEVVRCALMGAPLQFPDSVPAELQDLCRKAMHVSPAQRFGSVQEFQRALRDFRQHAESRALADASWERLNRLRAAAEEDADGQHYPLFSECRFGFQQALRLWQDNREAREGLQCSLQTMAGIELNRGAVEAAELLMSQLPEPDPALQTRLDSLKQGQQLERQELLKLRQDRNKSLGSATRKGFILILGLVWSSLSFGLALGWLPRTHESQLWAGSFFCALIVGCILLWRRSFGANRFNRHVAKSAFLFAIAILCHRGAAAVLAVSLQQATAQESGLLGLLFAMMAMTIDRHFLRPAWGFLCAGFASLLWPQHAFTFMGLACVWGTGALAGGSRLRRLLARGKGLGHFEDQSAEDEEDDDPGAGIIEISSV